jgi:VIT1/CCC1 family predicted Fe2+/Mn2+ transporter
MPLAVAALSPFRHVPILVILVSLTMLGALGATAARTGRAPVVPAVLRVLILGAAAMVMTIGLGRLLGTAA